MASIDKKTIKELANSLYFEMSEGEYDSLLREFSWLLEQMEAIGRDDDLDEFEPMTFPFECSIDSLREDEVKTPLSRDDVLSNAPSQQDGAIKIPKVVG